MLIHYRQYTDTFSILNCLQNHCLWKKQSKVGPILSRKFQITYKIIVCGEKTVKIDTLLSRKSSKDPSWLAMCNVYIRNELLTGLPARFNAIQHKGDILLIQTCGDFYVLFVYRYCHEQSTCRIVPWIFRQSIISTIDNSTILNTALVIPVLVLPISEDTRRIIVEITFTNYRAIDTYWWPFYLWSYHWVQLSSWRCRWRMLCFWLWNNINILL